MTQGLPCPNPTCTHTFAQGDIQRAATLSCPRCGNVFQLGAGAAPAAAAPAPLAADPAPPALAPSADSAALHTESALVRRYAGEGSTPWTRYAFLGGVVFVALMLALGGIYLVRGMLSGGSEEDTVTLHGHAYNLKRAEERAFKLVLPRGAWSPNEPLKRFFNAVVALEHEEPSAWLVIAVQDYGTLKPRDGELLKRCIERLEKYFGEKLEVAASPEQRELAGQRALVLPFRGEVNSVVWRGEAWALTYHGFAYWLYVGASPDVAAAQQVFKEMNQRKNRGFMLATDRRGWSEQPLEIKTFYADRPPPKTVLSVKAPEGIWEAFRATDADTSGQIYLHGRDWLDKKDNLKSATALVLALPREARDLEEAMQHTRTYIEGQKKKELESYRLVPVHEGGSPQGEVVKIGNKLGRLLELKLQSGNDPRRYVMLAVVQEGEHIYAIRCESQWEHFQAWRGDFLDLLATFEVKEERKR